MQSSKWNSMEVVAFFTEQSQILDAVHAENFNLKSEIKRASEKLYFLKNVFETQFITETRVTDLLLDRVGIRNRALVNTHDKIKVKSDDDQQKQSVDSKQSKIKVKTKDHQNKTVSDKQEKIKTETEDHQKESYRFSSALNMLQEGSLIMLSNDFPVYNSKNWSLGTFVQYENRKGKWLDANVVHSGDDDGSVTLLNLYGFKLTTTKEKVRLRFGSTVELKNSGYWVVIHKIDDVNTYTGYASDASHCLPTYVVNLCQIPAHSVRFINNIMSATPTSFHPFVRNTRSYDEFCSFYRMEQSLHLYYVHKVIESGLLTVSIPLDLVSIFRQAEVLLLKDQSINSADPLIPKTPITQQRINAIFRDN
jgi:hypothetical protein